MNVYLREEAVLIDIHVVRILCKFSLASLLIYLCLEEFTEVLNGKTDLRRCAALLDQSLEKRIHTLLVRCDEEFKTLYDRLERVVISVGDLIHSIHESYIMNFTLSVFIEESHKPVNSFLIYACCQLSKSKSESSRVYLSIILSICFLHEL